MEDTFFYKIVGFLSDYFEILICVNGAFLAAFVLALIVLKLRDVNVWLVLQAALKSALYYGVIAGQLTLFFLFGYIYWQNYEKPAPQLNLSRDVLATTGWVKNNTRVYFIDDNKLRSVTVNDRHSEDVFLGKDPIKEYHFSPDGKYLTILTQKELFLLDRKTKQSQLIDTLEPSDMLEQQAGDVAIKGSISGIQWAPDSQKIVYEIAKWSKFSAQDGVNVYDLLSKKKRPIKSPARRISSLYWDQQSENLYYFYHEAQDTSSVETAPFQVKVFRISLETLTPELITRIPFDASSLPLESLHFRSIDLFLDGDRLSFGRPGQENDLVSAYGSLGIDQDDYLYFMRKKWFRKRLYKILREPKDTDVPRYQYKGGDLIVDNIRWIPGGRYAIMEHKYWGVLILEPATKKVGLLIRASGHTFGWYEKDNVAE